MDGQKVRNARKRALLTLRALAEKSGVGYATIARIETNVVKDAHPGTLQKLADALGVDPVELMSEQEVTKK